MLFVACFCIWLDCEYLQYMCCQTGVFSICMCFLQLQHVELSRPPYFPSLTTQFCRPTGVFLSNCQTYLASN